MKDILKLIQFINGLVDEVFGVLSKKSAPAVG